MRCASCLIGIFRSGCVVSFLDTKYTRSSKCGCIPQLENGELLRAAETAGFDVMLISDQNIVYQQNLASRKLALIVLGSNIWPIGRDHGATIRSKTDAATPGSYAFIEMPLPPKPQKKRS